MSPSKHSASSQRTYTILDYRLEKPRFELRQVRDGDVVRYEVSGTLNSPVPPIRDSKYLSKTQCIEIYRWMLLNRKMEVALENLYKQGKVVGGVYFGLGQEGCSCASAYALKPDEWLGPMIRNQGSLLVSGFSPRDIMMQYMAKAGSPTEGRDASSHFGDIQERNVVAPISTLGDLIPVLAGVALGARMPFFVRAAIIALQQYPIVNASLDGDSIRYHRHVNTGIAVALDWGLIVPVLKNADELNFLGLQRGITDLGERSRTKKLTPDEVQGSTFTITNPGTFGAVFGLPIINQPNVAIMAARLTPSTLTRR